MGNTMKGLNKSNSKAKFAEALSAVLEVLERNSHKDNDNVTTIEITVRGATTETLELEIENLNEVIKMFKLNKG